MNKEYYCLEAKDNNVPIYGQISSSIIIEKKSKFISYVFNISNAKEAEEHIEIIKKQNKEARHVVYIYSYIDNGIISTRFSDDGEPNGTATKSINELLNKEKIVNTCIVIVRYFGGILLGTGLLTRTYLNVAKEALKKCEKKILHNYVNTTICLSYERYNEFKYNIQSYILNDLIEIISEEFSDTISIKLKIEESIYQKLKTLYNI